MKKFAVKMKNMDRSDRRYWQVISTVAVACGTTALAQSNPVTNTNVPVAAGLTNSVTDLGQVNVVGQLDHARNQISTDLGASTYSISKEQISSISQGDNAPMNQVILRAPGVAQDSAANGDLHVRGEHANLQYRIDGVQLPEGLSGFGLELDPRFVQSLQLITGSLPAQYGYRTAGVVDIQTKSGSFDNGGDAEIYGGSHDTLRPSFETGGTDGKFSYFVDGSYTHSGLGIENVTPSATALHDVTDQYKTFTYLSYLLDDTSRISFIGSLSYADYQIPVNPNQQPVATIGNGITNAWAPATIAGSYTPNNLNDNQNEQNYYGVLAYQKDAGDLNLQVAAFGRNSSAHYVPGNQDATLYYNGGVATDESRNLYSGGVQADASYELNDNHTLRAGLMSSEEAVSADTTTTVLQYDNVSDTFGSLESITQDNAPHAFFYGMYLQDEWKLRHNLTLNYGTRFDLYSSTADTENQVSPRANLVYQVTPDTTLHAGYSRYFTPPPLETVPAGDITAFNNTTAESSETTAGVVRAERANYYDLGVSQQLAPGLQVGLDGYYKTAVHQLDDGLFGQSLILSSFNYTRGKVEGVELTGSYTHGGFSTYANLACSQAQGEGASSAQFLWGNQYIVNYVNNHWIALDHDQLLTGSFGTAYAWQEGDHAGTRVYMDALYGSGLRQDGGPITGDPYGDSIPNGSSVPAYYSINVGAEQAFKFPRHQVLKARLDIVNLTDNSYELRSGSGVGVNAAQYGARLGFFGSLSYSF